MSCKVLDQLLETVAYDFDSDIVKEHINSCTCCQNNKLSSKILETKLNQLYDQKNYNSVLKDRIMVELKPARRTFKILPMVASLLLFITVIFNQDIITFAKNIPLVEILIESFEREDDIESVLSHDYPVIYDEAHMTIDGPRDYKLYLRDIYTDGVNFYLQAAFENAEGELIKSPVFDVSYNRSSITTRSNSEGVWSKFKSDWLFTSPQFESEVSDNTTIYITLKEEREDLRFGPISLDTSYLMQLPNKVYTIDQELDAKHGTISVSELIVTPINMKLKIEYDGQENYNGYRFNDIELRDNNGKIYNIESGSYGPEAFVLRFEETAYYDENLQFQLSIPDYSVHELITMEIENTEEFEFTHNGKPFVFKIIINEENPYYGYIKADEPTDPYTFPRVIVKDDYYWGDITSYYLMTHYMGDRFTIEPAELVKEFQLDLIFKSNMADEIYEYIDEKYGDKVLIRDIENRLSSGEFEKSWHLRYEQEKIIKMKIPIYGLNPQIHRYAYQGALFEEELNIKIDIQ